MPDHRQSLSGLPSPRTRGFSTPLLSTAVITAVVCGFGLRGALPALAQPPAGGFVSWKDVELSPQFKEVTTALKGEGRFDDTAREFVASVILPQLDIDENLPTLGDVRKKIRDRFLLAIGNETSFEQASLFVRDRLNGIARDTGADLLQRVNAVVFIGEMTDMSRNPWPPALETLAAAAGDTTLDPAVRIAAVAGISTHLSRLSRMTGDQAAAARKTVASALPGLLPSPPAEKRTEGEDAVARRSDAASWLASRSFGLIPQVVNQLPSDLASRLAAVLDDPSWPIDVRVRAAATIGKTLGPDSGVKPQAVLDSIRSLAVAALDADRMEGRRLTELQSFKAGGEAGPGAAARFVPRGPMSNMAGMDAEAIAEDGLSTAVCRRAAWRLYTLGEAIVSDAKAGGVAALLETDAAAAQQLASLLKENGEALDAEPYGYVLLEALDAVDPAGAKKRAGIAMPPGPAEKPGDNAPTVPNGDKPAPKPGDSPFGDSPF